MTTPHITTAASEPLHMVRAELNVAAFQRWAGRGNLISRSAFDDGYAMHCLLVESFGELAPKPFRLFIPRDRNRKAALYGYCGSDAGALKEASALYACPLQQAALPPSSIMSKPMPASWKQGHKLGFEALIRPVIRRAKGGQRPGAETDAFQWEACRRPKGEMELSREDVYGRWLADRLQLRGARLDRAKLTSFQRTRDIRKRGAPATEGPRALMQGVLTVTDGGGFHDLVTRGIGRHRAYGYGMLLLRPALSSTNP